jgi:hypothetical protein
LMLYFSKTSGEVSESIVIIASGFLLSMSATAPRRRHPYNVMSLAAVAAGKLHRGE